MVSLSSYIRGVSRTFSNISDGFFCKKYSRIQVKLGNNPWSILIRRNSILLQILYSTSLQFINYSKLVHILSLHKKYSSPLKNNSRGNRDLYILDDELHYCLFNANCWSALVSLPIMLRSFLYSCFVCNLEENSWILLIFLICWKF